MKTLNLNLNFENQKAFPSPEFSSLWNFRSGRKPIGKEILKDEGFSFIRENDQWLVVSSLENPPLSIEIADRFFDALEIDKPSTPPKFEGNKGAPYDSSDLNKFRPNGCLRLDVRGKNGDQYVVDSTLEVVEIIASYLPIKRETSSEKETRLAKNADQLSEMIKTNPEKDELILGKNKKNEFLLTILNRNGVS